MAVSQPQALEAILFAAGEPLTRKKLAGLLHTTEAAVADAARTLSQTLEGRGVALIETENEYELRTAPETADLVRQLREGEMTKDLGRAGLEALAVVLYQGGATRSEIDWIRGVNSAQTVRSLMLRGLVERIEDPTDKRKFRYRATTDALAHLGVSRAEDLPRYAELAHEAVRAAEGSAHTDA